MFENFLERVVEGLLFWLILAVFVGLVIGKVLRRARREQTLNRTKSYDGYRDQRHAQQRSESPNSRNVKG